MYNIILIILTIIMFFFQGGKKNFLKIVIGIFFILSFIRWERGTDWIGYYNNFTENTTFLEFINAIHFDKGYQIINFFIKKITTNYTVLLFFQGMIISFLTYKMISKYSNNYFISIWFYYGYYFGNIFFVRSTLATALVFYSIKYIIERKKIKYIILIFIATSIHYSAIIFLPAYWIFRKKLKLKTYIILWIIIICISLMNLNEIIYIVFKEYSPHRLVYLDNSYIETVGSKSKYVLKAILIRTFMIVFYLYGLKDYIKKEEKIRGFFNLYIVGCFLLMITSNINPMLSRISEFYDIVQMILISYLSQMKKNKILKLMYIIFVIYIIYNFEVSLDTYKDLYSPYKTIWNKNLEVKIF